MRRAFILPEEDTVYLDRTGLPWETISDGGNWLLIQHYPVPEGYNIKETTVALKIDTGYPTTQIDMAYFFPPLQRVDGKIIGALAYIHFDGKQWQRWSRHRTQTNPWRAGIDNIETHMLSVKNWLEREFQIR